MMIDCILMKALNIQWRNGIIIVQCWLDMCIGTRKPVIDVKLCKYISETKQ